MRPGDKKRLAGRKVVAVASFDSFAKMAMALLSACRREGAETTLYLLEISNRACPKATSGIRADRPSCSDSKKQLESLPRTDRLNPRRR